MRVGRRETDESSGWTCLGVHPDSFGEAPLFGAGLMTPPGDVHPDSFGEAPLFGAGLMTPPGDLTEGLPRGRGFKGILSSTLRRMETCGRALGRGHETRAQQEPRAGS